MFPGNKMGYEEEGEFELIPELEFLNEAEIPPQKNSKEYIRWVQRSLNNILGLKLKEDGVMGMQTRSAIRSFQQKVGLVADGIPGPKTHQALTNLIQGLPASPLSGTVCAIPVQKEIAWERANPAGKVDEGEGITLWNFGVGQADLKPEHIQKLRDLFIREGFFERLFIEGHASCSGTTKQKKAISERRAKAVKDFLRRNIPSSQMLVDGFGDLKPKVPNTSPENMAMNRRVEIRRAVMA